jgi:hypothetical protein
MAVRRVVAFATLAALAGASAALAGSPQSLLLQKSDVPAGAKKLPLKLGKSGTFEIGKGEHVRLAAALYSTGTKYIGTAAGVFGSSSAATRGFARFKKPTGSYTNVKVSGLGDQQRALGLFGSRVSSVVVLVRKGAVIWETAYSVLGKTGRSAVVSAALSYARKQKARVG